MKKTLGIFLFLLIAWESPAQVLRIGAEIGEVTNFTRKDDPLSFSNSDKITSHYQFGVMGAYQFRNNLWVETGLSYGNKEASFSNLNPQQFYVTFEEPSQPAGTVRPIQTVSADFNYIHFPLLVGYSIKVARNFQIIPKVGPYFSFGIGGKSTIWMLNGSAFGGQPIFTPGAAGYMQESFKRTDVGMRMSIELNYKNFVVRPAFNLGLTNFYSHFTEKPQNRSLDVSIGYYFFAQRVPR